MWGLHLCRRFVDCPWLDVLPETLTHDLGLVIAGDVPAAVCAQRSVRVPLSPVPITGQTFAVVLAGASLGSVRGGASQLLYLDLGLALPVYAGGADGWHVLSGLSRGYIVAFPIAAYVIGRLAERGCDRHSYSSQSQP